MANPLSQAALLLDSDLASEPGFMTEPEIKTADDGSRMYGELNTGTWWPDTVASDKMPEVSC